MENNTYFKYGTCAICAIISAFALTLFVLHAQGQNAQGLDVLNVLTRSNFNSTTEIQSSIPNITVTKLEIVSPNSIGLTIKYSGIGKSPTIDVESSAIKINSKLEDISNQIGVVKDNSTNFNASDSTTSIVAQLDRLGDILSSSNGTKTIDAGWKSPKSLTIKLKGNTTLDNAQFIGVVVS